LMAEKCGETIKLGYYTQSGINQNQDNAWLMLSRIRRIYSVNERKMISASQLLTFPFDAKKQYDFVDRLSGGELKRLYLCTVLIQNPTSWFSMSQQMTVCYPERFESFLLDWMSASGIMTAIG
jgi:ATP-binding cassette subfamily F protein uup